MEGEPIEPIEAAVLIARALESEDPIAPVLVQALSCQLDRKLDEAHRLWSQVDATRFPPPVQESLNRLRDSLLLVYISRAHNNETKGDDGGVCEAEAEAPELKPYKSRNRDGLCRQCNKSLLEEEKASGSQYHCLHVNPAWGTTCKQRHNYLKSKADSRRLVFQNLVAKRIDLNDQKNLNIAKQVWSRKTKGIKWEAFSQEETSQFIARIAQQAIEEAQVN